MATANKENLIRNMTGLNSPGPRYPNPQMAAMGQPAMPPNLPPNGIAAGQAMAAGGDNMPAQITDHQGNPQAPATLKQGEIVFSVESIIGAGNGDYNKGVELLMGLHDKLQMHGDALKQKQSLAGASGPSNEPPTAQMNPQGLAMAANQGLPG